MAATERTPNDLTDAQRRAVEGEGPVLVLGAAGTGKREVAVRRLAWLAEAGVRPERVLVLTGSPAAASRLRRRAGVLLEGSFDELRVASHSESALRLLREHSLEAGVDPFLEPIGPVDRLAMLLDRLDRLPLRNQEIRGNPAGLLRILLARIDCLKAESVSAERLGEWARERELGATSAALRQEAIRYRELAELYAEHDRLLREAGAVDEAGAVLEALRLLREQPDVRSRVHSGIEALIALEWEDASFGEREFVSALAEGGAAPLVTCDDDAAIRRGGPGALDRLCAAGPANVADFHRRFPSASTVTLDVSFGRGQELLDAAHAIVAPLRDRIGKPLQSSKSAEEGGGVRLWRCSSPRAQAQAVAREIERLLAAEDVAPDRICVAVGSARLETGAVIGALDERGIPFHVATPGALFARPEVRDVIAWLRILADPGDAAAAVRVATRPPIELGSIDVARCTTIARRRKLDMVSAFDAALESPQIGAEAREKIQALLKLYRQAASALEKRRADVFVRRLIERVGMRRHQLFAAHPEATERLLSLSRLGELAAAWSRREPRASTRDFIRYLRVLAEGPALGDTTPLEPAQGAVAVLARSQLKGLEFDHVYLLGLERRPEAVVPWSVPDELFGEELPPDDVPALEERERRLLYVAMTGARKSLVLTRTTDGEWSDRAPAPIADARAVLGAEEEVQEEALFGPAEDLEATYRMIRDEVLEASWRAGGSLGEPRLDIQLDAGDALIRFLELVKLAALIQHPGDEPLADRLKHVNDLLAPLVSEESRGALVESALDEYLLDSERERERRRELLAAREEPSLEAFLPRRGEGLALSASDIELYRTCPLKYKFARVFAIPQEPTINQRFGILMHQVLERFHSEEERRGADEERSIDRLLTLFESGWRRAGFGSSDDELQYRDRAIAALARYHERHERSGASPVWLERSFTVPLGPHQLRGRVDRVDRRPEGGYELIDYKTGERKSASELAGDLQLSIYRMGARDAWSVEPEAQSYYYVLDDEKVSVETSADDLERVERTVLEVGEGILGQDFEPRPSPQVCSWCDYRLICPAAES